MDMTDDSLHEPEPPPPPRPPWRQDETEGLPSVAKVSPRRRVVVGVLAFLTAGLVVYLSLLWLRPLPRPVLFTWNPADYPQLPFGSVPFAAQDQKALDRANWFTRKPLSIAGLAEAQPQETIVVSLKGRAMCDGDGRVFLLSDEAEPGSAKGSLPLRKVLLALAESPARHKFVILDLFWPATDPYLADLAHDIPSRVVGELEAIPDDRRLALLSCQTGQVPLAAPELGGTVFGHYLDEGLRGWADTEDSPRDDRGRVTARRLGQFVKARVDRWSRLNRQVRQTPVLIGDAADFPLVAFAKGEPEDHRELAAAPIYPPWLIAGWKTRERWQAEERFRDAAWMFRQLDVVLLTAERDWSDGGDPARIEQILRMEIDRLERTYAPLAAAPKPEPTSLAQIPAIADPKLVKSLEEVVKKVDVAERKLSKEDAGKLRDKLVEELTASVKSVPDIALAAALFTAAVDDPFPRRGTIQLYDGLLKERDPEPRFEETLTLHRLARMADGVRDDRWPVRAVRKALELTRRATLADSRPHSSARLRSELEAAAQARHEAEVLFFSPGFAPVADAERALEAALAAYDLLLGRQESLERASRTLDQAFDDLPWHLRRIDVTGDDDADWLRAVAAAEELAGLLEPPPPSDAPPSPPVLRGRGVGGEGVETAKGDQHSRGATTPSPRPSPPEERGRGGQPPPPPLEDIAQKTQELESLLTNLRRPTSSAVVDELIRRARGPDGDGGDYSALESMLLVPWGGAERRAEIWKTCRQLGGTLARKSADRDKDDKQKAPDAIVRLGDSERFRRDETERVAGRVRRALALIALAGTKANHIESLRQQAIELGLEEPETTTPGVHAFEEALWLTWTQFLPAQWSTEPRPAGRERLARVWPGWFRPANMTAGLVQATAAPFRDAQVRQWAWLGELFRFEARDPDAPGFFARAAFALRPFTPPPGPYIVLPSTPTPVEINPARPTAKVEIPVQFLGGPFPRPLAVSTILPDDEWLDVSLGSTELSAPDKAADSNVVPLVVSATLRPGAELSTAPRPLGFLVRIDHGDRASFHRMSLPYLPDPERVELILSSNPQQPAAPVADLRLRPSAGAQSYYLFARNGTDKPRNLQIELRVDKQLVPGGSVNVLIGPRQTGRVEFPGIPKDKLPKKDDEPTPSTLPPLKGPLQLRVLDKETNEVLADRIVKVGQASPREYVRVPSIRFEPAGPDRPKNKLELTVRAGSALAGPPCVVELVLPPNRIPGLKAVRDGVFRGELRKPGDEIKLYATDLEFEPGTEEDGVCTLTIDGIPRAMVFRVTYARFGEPTTPREEDRPSLRIISDRYFRTEGPWEGTIEVDNPPGGTKLEAALGRYSETGFEPELRHDVLPPRQQGIGFAVRPGDGALVFEPFTRDWRVGFGLVSIRGERVIHARLRSDSGVDVVPPVDHVVIFDNQPPDGVAFVDLPKRAQLGSTIELKATGQDKGVGVREVVFFVGTPDKDGKIPEGAPQVNADPVQGKEGLWSAKVAVPGDKKGIVPISVMVANRVGLKSFAKGMIELVDFDPVKNEPGEIQGAVVEGDLPQPGLVVILLDEKGNKLAEKKAGPQGTFHFDKVRPGTYTLVSEKPAAATRRRAVSSVTVAPGQSTRVRLALKL